MSEIIEALVSVIEIVADTPRFHTYCTRFRGDFDRLGIQRALDSRPRGIHVNYGYHCSHHMANDIIC